MARMMRVSVEGMKDVDAALQHLSKRTSRAAILRGMKKALKPMQDTAKQYAPYRHGWLEESITMTTKRPADYQDPGKAAYAEAMRAGATRTEAGSALRAAVAGTSGVIELFMGPDRRPSAIQQEFGNRNHPADPFMRPAFDAEAVPTFERIADEIGREISKSAARSIAKAAKQK